MRGHTKNNSKKSKAAAVTAKNPLAAARSGKRQTSSLRPHCQKQQQQQQQQQQQKPPRQQQNAKAEQIWHKRSGGGLQLFVEYYSGQPEGVVFAVGNHHDNGDCNHDEEHKVDGKIDNSSSSTNNNSTISSSMSKGMSRASQRRRKKRKRQETGHHEEDEESAPQERLLQDKKDRSQPLPWHDQSTLLYNGQLLELLNDTIRTTKHGSDTRMESRTNKQDLVAFFHAISKPLPLTFRIRKGLDKTILQVLQSTISDSFSDYVRPMTSMDDDKLIYHSHRGLDKASLPKVCPQLKEFLNVHSNNGTIARQELGSMLPVWLLEKLGAFDGSSSTSLKPQQMLRVLDLCASPGSKTLQAAELLLLRSRGGKGSSGGQVRANDIHESRLQALKEAIQRSGVVGTEEVIKYANVDASLYPIPKTESKKYPIIICDVPCSGDGTCRKDLRIIPNWLPRIGNALHGTQLQILVRALRCVSRNGFVSYSTCSLNPVEDEAVVAAALSQLHRQEPQLKFKLVSVPNSLLKSFVMRPGVHDWRVADYVPEETSNLDHDGDEDDDNNDDDGTLGEDLPPKLKWYDTYEAAVANHMKFNCATMWPLTPSKEEGEAVNLSHCLRLFPQDQDTGGFFVAIIKRMQ
jgi:16S rRNA C967 or C1407 C5-methylase (RsmB/RsmF family)